MTDTQDFEPLTVAEIRMAPSEIDLVEPSPAQRKANPQEQSEDLSRSFTLQPHRSGVMSPSDLDAAQLGRRIKKDALYKPLLRKFRNFYRKLLDAQGLSKGCHYWTADRMKKQIWKFMHQLELPRVFMDTRSLSMIMLIIFPTIAKKRRHTRQFCEELEIYFEDIRLSCFEIFKENNVKKRRAFFSEPLIKYLWRLFVHYKPDAIIHHLRRTRSYPFEGE